MSTVTKPIKPSGYDRAISQVSRILNSRASEIAAFRTDSRNRSQFVTGMAFALALVQTDIRAAGLGCVHSKKVGRA